MYLCKFGGDPSTGSEDRTQKRLILQFLKDGDLEKIHQLVQKIMHENTIFVQFKVPV